MKSKVAGQKHPQTSGLKNGKDKYWRTRLDCYDMTYYKDFKPWSFTGITAMFSDKPKLTFRIYFNRNVLIAAKK